MIKIVKATHAGEYRIHLRFSTGEEGTYDLRPLVEQEGSMVKALRELDFFRQFFIELGALGWRNGFELSPEAIYRELRTLGALRPPCAA